MFNIPRLTKRLKELRFFRPTPTQREAQIEFNLLNGQPRFFGTSGFTKSKRTVKGEDYAVYTSAASNYKWGGFL